MNRKLTYEITRKDSALTVESFLKTREYSRQVIIQLKKTKNGILVNGEWAYVKTVLKEGDFLEIFLEETVSSEHIPAVSMPLSIVYEDEDILVLNKPCDTPVHPSINNYENTLANGVAWYYQEQGETFIFRCINRLDRDTTGLLVLAKNTFSASVLSAQMKRREIHRTYLAAVCGTPEPSSGTISAPIARKDGSAIERCVDFEHGETAVTHYSVEQTGDKYSLVKLQLETGRTHQIRIHMNHIGHPLPGDYLYHPDFTDIQRVALHSYKLEFLHPITKEELHFTAPLPDDMKHLF